MDHTAPHHSTALSITDPAPSEGASRRCIRYVGCLLAVASVVWGPAGGLGQPGSTARATNPDGLLNSKQFIDAPASRHGEYLAAGFGFQSSESALLTIKTYHTRTGTVLSEESFDLNVQEDGMSMSETQRGRIFAGGIGVDPSGPTKFLLRAYDAVTGHFLWEGQLSFRSHQDESKVRPIATVIPFRSTDRPLLVTDKLPVRVYLSLRAMDSQTGRIVWEDRFAPGVVAPNRGGVVHFRVTGAAKKEEPLAYVFDLVVRALDPKSARLLWQDSFEDHDAIDGTERGHEEALEPQISPRLPQWKGGSTRL